MPSDTQLVIEVIRVGSSMVSATATVTLAALAWHESKKNLEKLSPAFTEITSDQCRSL